MAGEEQLDGEAAPGLDPEDREAFREAMADVEPLVSNRAVPDQPAPPPVAVQRQREVEQARLDLATGAADPEPAETGEEAFWCRQGLQHRLRKRLRSGQIPVEGTIDLHGLRVEEARESLGVFLHQALTRGLRCVRVVHGKGRRSPGGEGVLRGKVQKWLSRRKEVLAFASCTPVDGGTGALYVLLKK
ncbi:Smr/MutS family protein [Thiohalorhabdus methylotrophus]|uniref:Smr/MutS family protein n=1 Tax=Thiohalorhabdus methylotrophus TaxID=3242694 RepID=A0ABV4TZJ0_9GAMM